MRKTVLSDWQPYTLRPSDGPQNTASGRPLLRPITDEQRHAVGNAELVRLIADGFVIRDVRSFNQGISNSMPLLRTLDQQEVNHDVPEVEEGVDKWPNDGELALLDALLQKYHYNGHQAVDPGRSPRARFPSATESLGALESV